MIGSISLFSAGSTYKSVNTAKTAAKDTGPSDGLTESQRFTQRHAGLSASDYISSYLEFSQQTSAQRLKSGDATDTFSVRFNDRTYTLAGKKLDGLNLQAARLPDVRQVPAAQAVPNSAIDLIA